MANYYQAFGNRSDLLLVSTYDILKEESTSISSNPLFFAGYVSVNEQVSAFWGCEAGSTNTIECRNPQLWVSNPALVDGWNVLGYEIDHCLSAQQSLRNHCEVRFSLPIMIGKF
jgi:hypothetical protein